MKNKKAVVRGSLLMLGGACSWGFLLTGLDGNIKNMVFLAGAVLLLSGFSIVSPEQGAVVASWINYAYGVIKGNNPPPPPPPPTDEEAAEEVSQNAGVAGSGAPAPQADAWNIQVRPALHRASQYTAPIYYLNSDLQVIDWNIAFDLIFERITGQLRGQHVNWFIVRLANRKDVFAHAAEFPKEVDLQPQVDTEPIVYSTRRFGSIEFEKVATKLHDSEGRQHGWAVTLLIRRLDKWDDFLGELKARVESDKFWSLYSVSYDLVLKNYPEYDKLLTSVAGAIPPNADRVVDLGAGTGNASRKLLQQPDRTVWAVEKNIAMLDRLRVKDFAREAGDRLKIVKSSVEHLDMLRAEFPLNAAIAVNVLYAVDDVPGCLKSLNRVLAINAPFVFSTTDSNTRLAPLLADIAAELGRLPNAKALAPHVARVVNLNQRLERDGLTTRYASDQYEKWLGEAGFEVVRQYRAYQNAVVVFHTQKSGDVSIVDDSLS